MATNDDDAAAADDDKRWPASPAATATLCHAFADHSGGNSRNNSSSNSSNSSNSNSSNSSNSNSSNSSNSNSSNSTWAKCKAFLRRHRVALLTTAGVVLTLLIGLLLVGIVLITRHSHELQPPPGNATVDLGYARYAGLDPGNGVISFLGLRYAAAPVGNMRWRAPAPPPQTGHVQPATQFQPICLGTDLGFPVDGQSEDCLFANVWAPTNATAQSKLPVWLFIQGGGYVTNANGNWDGTDIVQTSGGTVVLVNFNYRVGLWGFLASDRVRQDGNLNAGLLDQRMMMRWVKTHIAQFGGDPDHVVLHGASAGAGSVALQLVVHGGRDDDLFVGGIAESIFLPTLPRVDELEWQFDRVANQTGCAQAAAGPPQPMACLRGLAPAALQAVNVAQPFPGRSAMPLPLFYWTPTVDGDLLPDRPQALYQQGKFVPVPVLIGTTTDEGSIFAPNAADPAAVANFLANNDPRLQANDTAAILEQYPLEPALPQHAAWFPSAVRAYGEATFICPNFNTLNAMAASNASLALFSYRFNVQDKQNAAWGMGVPHVFSSAAVWGPDSFPGAPPSYRTYNAPMVPVVMRYWLSFVRALDPNPLRDARAPLWAPWAGAGAGAGTGGRTRIVLETGSSRMETVPADEAARCVFWDGLAGRTEQTRRKGRRR